ncbi:MULTISPECIES: DUF2270 domain-containing protein [unclassified Salipiger]|uniref:DUF2270 domain-containing protein n=1 Tax=unclassified Salipiger TaxID=2640570 RepID=UPI00080AB8E5|nr:MULTISPECIES: DUF2270 domain-containing protein [unclassified Salipiger]ANT59183.1 hypothetical protein AYJ57_01700 [Salipiger sp. CCB-MM3]NDV98077.1 DUF2270 domain-containing protein [Salipiger sp. PrR002]NDW57052.1 DUF2270 domain-containing protein [Salipiger sp. PrR004]
MDGPEPRAAQKPRKMLDSSEITALSHLYRGEVYRSTIWRTRLDTTTNWAVVTLGIALSISYSSPAASPLPLILVGILILFFLMQEARRYRYFNVWRARCRWMETHFFAPMLHDGDLHMEEGWQQTLAEDYWKPRYHVSLWVAIGRRIRRNYVWILLIQSVAYIGKLLVHPEPLTAPVQLIERAGVGPIHGGLVLAAGAGYCAAWSVAALISWRDDQRRAQMRRDRTSMG